jgi:transcriptional regulator with XRE-family HTH domain
MGATPKARRLGAAMRKVREDQGIGLRDLAARLQRDPGSVSRWERGERTPKPEDVAQYLTALGIVGETYRQIVALSHDPDAPLWAATTLPEQQQQLAALVDTEEKASRITAVAPLLVPGLLQTEGYMRAIMAGGGVSATDAISRVAIRKARQGIITRTTNPVRLVALVGEPVLSQVIGSRSIMRAQFDHILKIAQYPNVSVRVIPFDRGWHPAFEGPFDLIESEHEVPVVQLEARNTGFFLHEESDVSAYRKAVRVIDGIALDEEKSARLLDDVIGRLEKELT